MTAEDEWALVDRVKAGGPDGADAFADLYRRYRPVVHKMIYFRSRNQDLAEDITAETFVKAFARINTLDRRPGYNPGAWIVTIARNLFFDYLKSARHRLEHTIGHNPIDLADGIIRIDPGPGPAEQIETAYVSATVRAAINTLPPKQRTVIELRYLADLTVEETCARTGWTDGVVKALTYRAVRRLGRTLTRESIGVAA